MEETNPNPNSKSKKKVIYYALIAVCALLLIAGLVLTVYFVTAEKNPVVEKPPVDGPENPGPDDPNDPAGPDEPSDPTGPSDPAEPDDPSGPTGGETVKFVAPIDCETYAVEYAAIYENQINGWWYRHKAVDFAAAAGTEVRSMAAGKVEEISMSPELGNLIVIDHGDGLKSVYRFVEPVEGLKAGDAVTVGQKIGEVATAYGSEAKDGEHLHLEVILSGDYVDPTDYIKPVLDEK